MAESTSTESLPTVESLATTESVATTESLPELIDEFFLARRPKKHSEHTLAAYRRDFDAISFQLADVLDTPANELRVEHPASERCDERLLASLINAGHHCSHLVDVESAVLFPRGRGRRRR
ncbi:MAG: hypothetical protein R2706_08930 [Acidimicrobiales bacterium]